MSAPLSQGYLKTPDGHEVYYMEFGNPRAMAAVVLHGGPGSSANLAMLDWFDLTRWRIVLFDQRGCGRSRPAGSLENNTTDHLVADIERLRAHLNIGEWVVVGGSWGAFLALAYAARHPSAINHLLLRGVFLPSERQLSWFFQDLRALVPQAWEDLTFNMTSAEKNSVMQTLVGSLLGNDPSAQAAAASRWGCYEDRVMAVLAQRNLALDACADENKARFEIGSDHAEHSELASATFAIQKNASDDNFSGQSDLYPGKTPAIARRINKFRIQSHYLQHRCFVDLSVLLPRVGECGINLTLVHGTHDWICPPENVHFLLRFLRNPEVCWVKGGTHTTSDRLIAGALARKLSRLV